MATHSSILAWRILDWSLAGYSPWDGKELDTIEHVWVPFFHFLKWFFFFFLWHCGCLGDVSIWEESEKVGLKLNIQKTKIMSSGPINSWQIDGETMETVTDCIFLGSKITADGDCSHEMKRHLLLGRKVMTNLDSILKRRDVTLLTKVCLVKAMVFPQ